MRGRPEDALPLSPAPVWTVFAGFIAGVCAMVLANGLLYAGADLAFGRAHPERLAAFVASIVGISSSAAVTVVALSAIAGVGAAWSGERPRGRLRLGPGALPAVGVVCAAVASLAASVAFSVGYDLAGFRDAGVLAAVTRAIAEAPLGEFGLAIVGLAILPAVGEELFFRGFIQTRLEARWGRWRAIVATALLFGVIHFDLKQGGFAFVAGLLLGWVASRAGSVRPAMLVHCANNLGSLVLGRLMVGPSTTAGKAVTAAIAAAVTGLAIAGLALVARRAARARAPAAPRRESEGQNA